MVPVTFNLFLTAATLVFHQSSMEDGGVSGLNGSLFNIRRLQTKNLLVNNQELQYADDCALLAHSPVELQHALDSMSTVYCSLGLINTQETEVL